MITTDVMVKKKRNTHYVNNRDFLDALVVYKKECSLAKENGTPRPRIPHYIGECFLKIATHYAFRPNWANYCVDSSTEALTQRGWLKYNEITLEDKILSYDQESKVLMWSEIKDLFINESYSGKMFHLTNQGLDMFVTPGHRVLTETKGLIPVEHISSGDSIILTGEPVEDTHLPIYSDSFVELVGWVITEGYIEFTPYAINIALSQNEGHKADRIRKCLKTLNLPHREYSKPEKTKLVTWAIKNHPLCGEIVGVAPDKVLSSHFILSLTHRQRLLLIDTMVNADGTTKSDGSRHYYQKCKKNIDQFIFLCTISGLTTSTKFIDNYVSFGKITHYYNVRIYINPKKYCGANKTNFYGGFVSAKCGGRSNRNYKEDYPNIPTEDYEGVIWCPTTEFGSFMCRRNGYVFLTGNSFKEDLISDAVENMSRYILNFDPEKSTNPFAYFTQITHYAFLRRIKLEKRETEKKAMIIERLNFDEVMSDDGQNMDNYSDYSSIRDNVYSRMRP
jgi:hypothetical protein